VEPTGDFTLKWSNTYRLQPFSETLKHKFPLAEYTVELMLSNMCLIQL